MAMSGPPVGQQERLFYDFCLEDVISVSMHLCFGRGRVLVRDQVFESAMSTQHEYENLIATYAAAVGRGDAKTVAGLFTEDATFFAPEQPVLRSRKEIEDYYAEAIGDGFPVTIKIGDLQDCGSVVYATGIFEFGEGSGRWLQVSKRQEDGSLLIHRLAWN